MSRKQLDPNKPVRAAGVLVMVRDSSGRPTEFLLMRHANRWDLPKGHCDGDETFAAAALRELEEETGIKGSDISLEQKFSFDLKYPVTYREYGQAVFEKQVRYFLGFLSDQVEIHPTEHESYDWIRWAPPHRIQSETIDDVLDAVAAYLQAQA